MKRIIKSLNDSSNELQPMYYTFLNIWLISYNKNAIKCFTDPTVKI